MTCAKYVVIKKDGFETAIVFSRLVQHSTFENLNPISAGTVQIFASDGGSMDNGPSPDGEPVLIISAYGKSDSLDLKSRPEDSEIIRKSIEQNSKTFAEQPVCRRLLRREGSV